MIKTTQTPKIRIHRELRMIPEYSDDPRIDAFAADLLETLELLNNEGN